MSWKPVLTALGVATVLVTVSVTAFVLVTDDDSVPTSVVAGATTVATTTSTTSTTTTTTSTTTTTTIIPVHEWVDRSTVGLPWGDDVVGLITFRGNPTNTFYGTGPLPETPEVVWRYPNSAACGQSIDLGVSATWCGNGWTGQPVVWERPDGVTEIMGGAYDHRFHFVDAATGEPTRPPLVTGDIVKGTPSLDPDGYPLVYFGSRDNHLRIVALDQDEPVVLWEFVTPQPLCTLSQRDQHGISCFGLWNDDWDAAPRVVNDVLFASSENSVFYIWKLNRTYDADGQVQVDPELLVEFPAWDDELIADIQDGCTIGVRCPSTSIESTPVFFEGRVYFGTSAGWVIGLDITNVTEGVAPKVFEYWMGDDSDGSIVIDEEGMLYVPAEWKRFLPRALEVGQLVKLDPYTDGDPRVWGMESVTTPPAQGGMFSTPALGDGVVYVVTNRGFLVVVDRETGEELTALPFPAQSWSSPVVIDDQLLVADNTGVLHAFDVSDPGNPVEVWTFKVGTGRIEATPAVWEGRIYIWNRDGFLYAVAEE